MERGLPARLRGAGRGGALAQSVIRLTSARKEELAGLADHILTAWRAYSDGAAGIYAETGGRGAQHHHPHCTAGGPITSWTWCCATTGPQRNTPWAYSTRTRSCTTSKKENIGLIEVMGLAVLPARLKGELEAVAAALVSGADLEADPATALHAEWARQVKARHLELCAANAAAILQAEVGGVFATVLEHAGVYKRSAEGQAAFDRFIASL